MQRSAAAFNASGTSLEKSVALITTTNAVLQNPETVGTLYKTLSARIRGAKTELQDLGEETDAYVESTSKLRDLVKGMTGFDILKEDGKTYKDIYDIILGIADKWDELSDIDQASLAEALAGKRAANGLFAVLQNPDELKKVYQYASDATGTAMREQEAYAKSIQFSIDKLKASAQALASDIVEKSWIKDGVDLLTKFVDLLDEVVNKIGLIPIGTVAGTIASSKGIPGILSDIRNGHGGFFTRGPKTTTVSYDGWDEFLENSWGSEEALERSLGTEKLNEMKGAFENVTESSKGAVTGLGVFGKTLASLAISAAIAGIYSIATAEREVNQAAQAAAESYNNVATSIDGYKQKLEQEYAVLRNSNSTYEEQYQARQNIYEIQKNLVEQFPEEATGINLVTDQYEAQVAALEKLEKVKNDSWQESENELNSKNTFGTFVRNLFKGYENNTAAIVDEMENASKLLVTSDEMVANKDFVKQIEKITGQTFSIEDPYLRLSGNLDEIYDKLLKIQSVSKDFGFTDFADQVGKEASKTKTKLEEISGYYQEHFFNETILGDADTTAMYERYSTAADEYQKAIASGDEAAVESARQEISDIFQDINTRGWTPQIIKWFHDLMPELQDEISKAEFYDKVNSKTTKRGYSDFKSRIKDNMSQFDSSEALENYIVGNGNAAQDAAYEFLNSLGVSLGEIIAYGLEEGFITAATRQDFQELLGENTYIDRFGSYSAGREKISEYTKDFTDEEIRRWMEVTEGIYDADKAIRAYEKSLLETQKNATPRDAIDNMLEMSDGFDILGTIYKDIQDGEDFDFKNLDSKKFEEAFAGLETEYSEFIATVSKNPRSIENTQEAFNKLATAYINNTIGLENINEENVDVVESMLEMFGITNAQEVATRLLQEAQASLRVEEDKLALSEKFRAENGYEIAYASYESAAAFLEEANAAAVVRAAIFDAQAQQQIFANSELDLDGKIQSLIALASAYKLTGIEAQAAAMATGTDAISQRMLEHGASGESAKQAAVSYAEGSLLAQAQEEMMAKITGAEYKGPSGSGGGSGSGDSSPADKIYDHTKRKIDQLNHSRTMSLKIAESEYTAYEDQISVMDEVIAKDNDLTAAYTQLIQRKQDAVDQDKAKIHELFDDQFGKEFVEDLLDRFVNGALDAQGFRDIFDQSTNGKLTEEQSKYFDQIEEDQEELEQAQESFADSEKQLIDDVVKKYEIAIAQIEKRLDDLQSTIDLFEGDIDLRTTSGSEIITEADYDYLIGKSQELTAEYENQLDVLYDELDEIEAVGGESSEAWYSIYQQINDVNKSIQDCEKSQAEWNETIKELPIRRTERYLEILAAIKEIIKDFQAEDEALGLGATTSQTLKLIEITKTQISEYQKLIQQNEDKLKTYTYGTDNFNDAVNAISSAKSELSGLVIEVENYSKQLLQIPVDKLNETVQELEAIKAAMEQIREDNDLAINSAITVLRQQIEEVNEAYDKRIEALKVGTEEAERQLAVEKARLALEQARGQLTNKVLKDGEFTWEANVSTIKNAQKELEDSLREKAIGDLESERSALVKQLEDAANKWEILVETINNTINFEKATKIFGANNWKELLLSGNDQTLYDDMRKAYEENAKNISSYEDKINEYNNIATIMSDYISEYLKGNLTIQQLQNAYSGLVKDSMDGFSSVENLSATLQAFGESDVSAALINSESILQSVYTEFGANLNTVAQELAYIGDVRGTWENIESLVNQLVEEAKRRKEEEERKVAEQKAAEVRVKTRTSSGGSSGGSSGWYSGDANNGPGFAGKDSSGTAKGKVNGQWVYADGIANGQVGSGSEDEKFKFIKGLSLTRLAPDEIPSLLHVGEAVLNGTQQSMLVNNLQKLLNNGNVPKINLNANSIQIGDIHVVEAQNVTDIAAGIMNGGLAQAINQELYRRR